MEVIKAGYQIIYEPSASVYHYHGINQNMDPIRSRNVVRILEEIDPKKIKIMKSTLLHLIPKL